MLFYFKALADRIRTRPLWSAVLRVLLVVGTITGSFLMLEASIGTQLSHLLTMKFRFIALNLLTIGTFLAFILLLCSRLWLSCAITAFVSGAVAIINHYVLMFHGLPLSFLMIKNFGTALDVLGSYKIPLHRSVILFAVMILFIIGCCLIVRYCTAEPSGWQKWIRNAVLLVCGFCVLYFGYFAPHSIKPRKTITWLWSVAYTEYGYAACSQESLLQTFNVVNKPDGYSEDAVDAVIIEDRSASPTQTPDILLILNETFYDLRQIMDLETDVSYLANIESMENLLTGYAVVPSNGGGTNSSEYELLTSNSLQLMPGVTPFNVLDLTGANSIVSVLEQQGYVTLGSHSESPENYNRKYGYASLGFDRNYFDTDFLDKEYYHQRYFETDTSIYRNLLRWYEEFPAESPRFLYNLTIQNHGAWERNDPEHDTIHVLGDYGDYTDDINEFLTSISFSDQAFRELTDYFAAQERPVIICMLGDHCPSFGKNVADPKYTGNDLELRLRSVPLVIWANFPLEDLELGTISINYVVPTLLELAGTRLTPYYSYMTQLREQAPILTSMGIYVDADGEIHKYKANDASALAQQVNDYFLLEYNNLSRRPKQELFCLTQD